MWFNWLTKDSKAFLSDTIPSFIIQILFFIICAILSFLLIMGIRDVDAGWFGRDKIPYDMEVGDTVVVKVPEKDYAVLCFDAKHEEDLFDCYIVTVKDFLSCIDDSYVERRPEPTPTPTKTPIDFDAINKPKD